MTKDTIGFLTRLGAQHIILRDLYDVNFSGEIYQMCIIENEAEYLPLYVLVNFIFRPAFTFMDP